MSDPIPSQVSIRPRLWRRLLSWALWTGFLGIVVGVTMGILGYIWFQEVITPGLPSDLSELRDYRPLTACEVFAADGGKIDEFYIERRIWVSIGDLADTTWQAFIAAEDRRFLEHEGVDWMGIARAFWVNVRLGSIRQGGSTITQQLVKNILVGKERSYIRKVREAALAVRLEREFSKTDILELYVNFIYLGGGNYGIEAAALDYFGISARDLNPGQAAMLAGLIPAPSRYSPRHDEEEARNRRDIVLWAMVEEGYITTAQRDEHLGDPVLDPNSSKHYGKPGDPDAAYVTQVRREVRKLLGPERPFENGLKVHTALVQDIQAGAVAAVRQAVEAVDERQGRRGVIRHLASSEYASFVARADGLKMDPASGSPIQPEPGDCFQAMVGPGNRPDRLQVGPFLFPLAESEREIPLRSAIPDTPPAPLSELVVAGDVLGLCLQDDGALRLDPRPWGEGAAVVIENSTGRVLALVGGYQATLEGYVRATQARRQPGSSFKPYVYGAALVAGYSQVDTVLDAPLALPGGNGKTWAPQNYGGTFFGSLPMRDALAKSLNTVSVRLVLEQGPETVARLARTMGVATPIRKDPTIALGSSEVTPLDQALGYATIARLGVPAEPVYFERVMDSRDREIGRAGGPLRDGRKPEIRLAGAPLPRALPTGVAYELLDMLRGVVKNGTARKAWKPGMDRAGKTGSTNGFQDAWFVGFTPRYTVAVWIGSDTVSTLGPSETGGRAALPAWIRIVDGLPQPEGERFPVPDDIVFVPHGTDWVGLRRGQVPRSHLAIPMIGDDPLPRPGFTLPAAVVDEAPPTVANPGPEPPAPAED